jgi:hypothetical protein
MTIITFGLNKLLGLTRVIQNAAIYNRFLSTELTDPTINVYANYFMGMNAKKIMEYILKEVYGAEESEKETQKSYYKIVPKSFSKRFSEDEIRIEELTEEEKLNHPNNNFKLIIKEKEVEYYRTRKEAEDRKEILMTYNFRASFIILYLLYKVRQQLGQEIVAEIEHGEHKLYNEMIRRSFENFFTQMAMPIEIVNNLRETILYDIFETLDGKLIMRPPRYNYLKCDENFNLDEKYVIQEDDIIHYSVHKDDTQLKTRVDCKWVLPYQDTMNMITGFYTDANLLVKYGLRVDAPRENPNVRSPKLGSIFSAIYLGIANAMSRQQNLFVKNDRIYEIGNLYFIKPLQRVGYLISATLSHSYGSFTTWELNFAFVRNVYYKTIKTDDDVKEAILIYRPYDYYNIEYKDANEKKTKQAKIIKKFEQKIKDKKLLVFKVVPTILDLIDIGTDLNLFQSTEGITKEDYEKLKLLKEKEENYAEIKD